MNRHLSTVTDDRLAARVDELVATGVFGETVSEVLEHLVRVGVQAAMKDGFIPISIEQAPATHDRFNVSAVETMVEEAKRLVEEVRRATSPGGAQLGNWMASHRESLGLLAEQLQTSVELLSGEPWTLPDPPAYRGYTLQAACADDVVEAAPKTTTFRVDDVGRPHGPNCTCVKTDEECGAIGCLGEELPF